MIDSVPRGSVVHLIPHAINRGGPLYARDLSRRLATTTVGDNVVVTIFSANTDFKPDVSLDVQPRLGRRLGYQFAARQTLRDWVRFHRPTVVVAHGGEALKYAATSRLGCPLIYYRIGLSSTELSRPVSRALYRFLCGRADFAVGISREVVHQLRTTLAVPDDKLRLIPNSRDPEVYRPADTGKASPPLVVFIGQIERDKRPDLFIAAVEKLRDLTPHFDAWLVGGGRLDAQTEARAAAVGVTITGRRSDVPHILGMAAVLVMTSDRDSEGMPGVLIEAGLSEVAVVSTPAAGVADVLENGITGLVVESSDPTDLADAVHELLRHPARRVAMGRAARQRCQKVFSVDGNTEQWRVLIEKARR